MSLAAVAASAGQPGRYPARFQPTYADVKYGPNARHVLDVWLANSHKPTPVLVSIHGGGFNSGDRMVDFRLLPACLKSGISVAAITYRLSGEAKAPAQFLDSARAVQFIRSKAKEWNLDPSRIAATGSSAGAGISLWLAFHDDLADPHSDAPVRRQSTRLTSVVTYDGQTSYDPRFIRDLFPGTETYKNRALALLFDVDLNKLDELPEAKYRLFEDGSPLRHLTKDDPPVLLIYTRKFDTPLPKPDPGVGIHHPLFGKALKEKMDVLSIECQVATDIQLQNDAWGTLAMNFLKKHFGVASSDERVGFREDFSKPDFRLNVDILNHRHAGADPPSCWSSRIGGP